ncbi:MAG: hypothetical protein ACOKSU_22385 [Pseudomonas sp.]|uniref:hypothetical protein n=1 Tax=Pseudomonas TaxID=286 RepID=UPI0003C08C24|nr:hypothetical protein [Pseudomonas sp. VLB120]AGZ33915.1 hypothetical protein PVLB_05540 [Pseudomonas sp. VLB120]
MHDLTINFGGVTAPPIASTFGLPPVYSLSAILDQVPEASLTPDAYKALYYPANVERRPTGSLIEALGYIKMLVPNSSYEVMDALYADLEAKTWENWAEWQSENPAY